MPPFADLFALLGIDLVLCAGYLRLFDRSMSHRRARWMAAAVFALLWLPVGAAQLPLLAYVRGVTSDFSITLIALAGLSVMGQWLERPLVSSHEKRAMQGVLAGTAIVLYPLALGLGDWDPYRLGWGSWEMLLGLLVISVLCWARGARWLAMLVALALLCWSADVMPSGNLWDYLLDPWLAIAALWCVAKAGLSLLWTRWPSVTKKPVSPESPGVG